MNVCCWGQKWPFHVTNLIYIILLKACHDAGIMRIKEPKLNRLFPFFRQKGAMAAWRTTYRGSMSRYGWWLINFIHQWCQISWQAFFKTTFKMLQFRRRAGGDLLLSIFTFLIHPTKLMFVVDCGSGLEMAASLPPKNTVLDAKTENIPEVFHCSM